MNAENRTTTDGKPPREGFENEGAPAPVKANGQHEAYWILTEEERAKGFVRPVRTSYRHVGTRPKHPLRDLTDDEKSRFGNDYVKFEEYPRPTSGPIGRYWTQQQLNSGCGGVTTMSREIAETYARDPRFYGATFCCHCGAHLRVGENGEFVWEGTDERVGT